MARPFRKKAPETPVRLEIKKNDIVKVIAGRDKGKQGRVLSVDRERGKLLVEHVMMIKRHTRPDPAHQVKGGIAEREGPIAVSNVMVVCVACGPVRMAHKVDQVGGKTRRTRVCRKCGAALDRKA
jgi:large subunit ribosomal protein L24